jgi:hypothetical protein
LIKAYVMTVQRNAAGSLRVSLGSIFVLPPILGDIGD